MKKLRSILLIILATILTLPLAACSDKSSETTFKFTCRNSALSEEKSMYFNDDLESIILNADLEIQDGVVKMQILDKQSNQVVWEKTADGAEKFDVELKNISANTEYFFQVKVEQAKYMSLTVTSPVKLVKNKEKPEIPEV